MRRPEFVTLAEAERRIGDWLSRGYLMFSDPVTHSTHLRRVSTCCAANLRDLPAWHECVVCGRIEMKERAA